MSLPTPVKTWQYNVNNRIASVGSAIEEFRTAMRLVKDALLGFGTLPWTVSGSCDAVTAGMDTVDRWSANSKLVWGGPGYSSTRSWIVLRQTGIATNFEILIDLYTGECRPNSASIWMSPAAAFTGGSTTARPTATDEVCVNPGTDLGVDGYGGSFGGQYTVSYARCIHIMQSIDGECTRVFSCLNGYTAAIWLFDKLNNAPTALTCKCVGLQFGDAYTNGSKNVPVYEQMFEVGRAAMRTPGGTTAAYMTTEGFGSGSYGQPLGKWWTWPGDINGKYPVTRIGLANFTLPASRGRLGTIYDLYAGSTFVPNGAAYPADGSFTMVQFGHLIVPWNGTYPRVRG